jgi:E3 ubiquitin-protein ligase RNF115/126
VSTSELDKTNLRSCFRRHIFKTASRFLRNTGLAVSLGLTALAAYHSVRDAMSETRGGGGGGGGHLDATGDREVVYCHQCHAEWYNDEHGLECPTCEGQITEIV